MREFWIFMIWHFGTSRRGQSLHFHNLKYLRFHSPRSCRRLQMSMFGNAKWPYTIWKFDYYIVQTFLLLLFSWESPHIQPRTHLIFLDTTQIYMNIVHTYKQSIHIWIYTNVCVHIPRLRFIRDIADTTILLQCKIIYWLKKNNKWMEKDTYGVFHKDKYKFFLIYTS